MSLKEVARVYNKLMDYDDSNTMGPGADDQMDKLLRQQKVETLDTQDGDALDILTNSMEKGKLCIEFFFDDVLLFYRKI